MGYNEDRDYDVSVTANRATLFYLAPGEDFKGITTVADPGIEESPACMAQPDKCPYKWEINETKSGGRGIVVVKPRHSKLDTNIAIFGTYYTYVINVTSVGKRTASKVRWDYPDLDRPAPAPKPVQPVFDPNQLDRNYKVSGDRVAWAPSSVFRLGNRVFIEFPTAPGTFGAPVLFAVAGDEARPIQYVISGRFYEFPAGDGKYELRGDGGSVRIERHV